ncbi:hypothetical protein N5D48_01030 [Pseudomonas sp. GD03858]|nr:MULTISPECIES: hypothetical protein [unclassified Pseudomonas]MDH0645354.1 hypothetical protein [Pseudomonas sp. GD03867]MDH0660976.1 hypothetical protein [Pseudomonas sp. GD03858]
MKSCSFEHHVDGSLLTTGLIPVVTEVGADQGFIMTPLLNLVLGFVDGALAHIMRVASSRIGTLSAIRAHWRIEVIADDVSSIAGPLREIQFYSKRMRSIASKHCARR